MSQPELKLAELKDYACFYTIRSEKTNLFWTGYDKAPNYDTFKIWFENRLLEEHRKIYLLWLDDQCLGFLNIDTYSDHCFIGYSIKSAAQGQGLATFMVKESVKLISTLEKQEIRAWINCTNLASLKVSEKNGFLKSTISETRMRFGKEELYHLMIKTVK